MENLDSLFYLNKGEWKNSFIFSNLWHHWKNVNSLQISGGKWLCKIAFLTNSGNKLFPSQRESQNEKKKQKTDLQEKHLREFDPSQLLVIW